jgi:hypothetical protein
VSTKALQGAKSLGNFLFSAVNKAGKTVSEAGAKIKKTVEENVSTQSLIACICCCVSGLRTDVQGNLCTVLSEYMCGYFKFKTPSSWPVVGISTAVSSKG